MHNNFHSISGRIRNKLDSNERMSSNENILSLSLLPGHYIYPPIEDRSVDCLVRYNLIFSWGSSRPNGAVNIVAMKFTNTRSISWC